MRHFTILVSFLVATFFGMVSAFASDNLGGPGESCRSRSDCRAGLKCIALTCVDEHQGESCGATSDCGGNLVCVANKCVTPGNGPMSWHPTASASDSASASTETREAPEEKAPFELRGVHPFFGLTSTGGPAVLAIANDQAFVADPSAQGSFIFAFRGGVMFGRNELAAELSPGTYAWYSNTGGGAFQFNVSYAHYLPIHEGRKVSVYWPLRVGAGLFTGHTSDLAFFQARADVVGVALRFGHVMVDFHAPSFRYGVSSTQYTAKGASTYGTASMHLFSWEIGTSVSYLF